MNYEELNTIQEQYAYCDKCKRNHSIGQGRLDAIGVLIVPCPVSNDDKHPTTYDSGSFEFKTLTAIFEKVGLDIDDWYITPTVGCKNNCNKEGVLNANERLKKLIYLISPKIIVLSGPQSYYSFFGKSNDDKANYKEVLCKNYKTYYAKDLSEYLLSKTNDDPKHVDYAKSIFNIWTTIKKELQILL